MAEPGMSKDILLRLGDGRTFEKVADLISHLIIVNGDTIDIVHPEMIRVWLQMLACDDIKTAHISGTGVFTDLAAEMAIRTSHLAGTTREWQAFIPGFGSLIGHFRIVQLEHFILNGTSMIFDIVLDSVGGLKFEAGQ